MAEDETVPVSPHFGRALIVAAVAMFVLYFAFTWMVDPYGVSPVNLRIAGFNEIKLRRLDIDRLIKPYEVWRTEPKTVFLGTSRIHQSMDPAVMAGTAHAPAYNASVPAVSLGMNEGYLEQYADIDSNLRTVFVELFIYNFLGQGQTNTPHTWQELVSDVRTLQFSADALWASVHTVYHNAVRKTPTAEIAAGGYYKYPPGHAPEGSFNGFPPAMWELYRNSNGGYRLFDPAFEAVRRIAEMASSHGIEAVFIATPNHAYYDAFVEEVGAWDIVEEWLIRLTGMVKVYSFSQPNEWVYEEVGPQMRYWNDPFHFSLNMGTAMMASYLGRPVEGTPADFMTVLTPADVPAHIAARRTAIRKWAADHPEFVKELTDARAKAGF